MPSSKKTLHFLGSGLMTSCAIGLLGFCMSTDWAETTMVCTPLPGTIYNETGTAQIVIDLFDGSSSRINCPIFRPNNDFAVFEVLGKLGGAPFILHVLSVGLLVVCMLCSVLSLLISLYNSVSNPYETYMGPIGFYACSSLSACLCLVVLIMFVVNVHLTDMASDASFLFIDDNYADTVTLTGLRVELQLGYYLLIAYVALSLLGILSIFLYQHAAYTHRKEQQKPTEDAPKEIMMY